MKDASTRRRTGRTRPHPVPPPETTTGHQAHHDDTGPPVSVRADPAPGHVGRVPVHEDPETRQADPVPAPTATRPARRPPSTGSAARGSGGRPRDLAREAQIVSVAVDLVAEEGLPGLTMDALAARAGASKATLYRRWPDRLALAVALLDTLTAQQAAVPDSGSTGEDLAAVLRHADTALQGPVGALLVGLAAEARRRPDLAEHLDRHVDADHARIRSVLTRGVDRGELRGDADLDLLAATVSSTGFERALTASPPLTRREATLLADRLLRPIRVAPAAGTR